MSRPHYQAILEELKYRIAQVPDGPDALQRDVAEQIRQRFIFFLDADKTLSLEEVLCQLEQKWHSDGLLDQTEENSYG